MDNLKVLIINTLFSRFRPYRLSAFILGVALLSACAQGPTKPKNSQSAAPALPQEASTAQLNEADQALYDTAMTQLVNGKPEKSQKILLRISQNNPNHLATKANLAKMAFHRGDLNQAFALAEQISRFDKSADYGFMLMGLVSVERGELRKAEEFYLSAIEKNARFADAHHNLALLYDVYFQELEKAHAHYQHYLALIQGEDQETADWVEQLSYSLPSKGAEQ